MAHSALQELLRIFSRNRGGEKLGIYSICASHPLVLEAAMIQSIRDDMVLLIESTANQVNQFGGYTGMLPSEFPGFVMEIANRVGLSESRMVFGGDHLGPLCWVNESAESAMAKARDLVSAYVRAGFKKIHLDTSMACEGDETPLTDEIVAARAADLCVAAEAAADEIGLKERPVYVIGTEVPVPGGATESLDELAVTSTDRALQTIRAHEDSFKKSGLNEAWARVVALVVQPGVEFNHTDIHPYDPAMAVSLSETILAAPGLVYEAHSTDYQPDWAYHQLVQDHFAILKVGPQLTFALREALFALCDIESELSGNGERLKLKDVCDLVMRAEPKNWVKHYPTSEPEGRLYRRYSYSDRIRYYWTHPVVDQAVKDLFNRLENLDIPLPLISQFLPSAYQAVRDGRIPGKPRELIVNHIMAVTTKYSEACRGHA